MQLPDVINEAWADSGGWIEFGRGPYKLYTRSTPPVRRIKPVKRLLITFFLFLASDDSL
ncbi:MAG TPA: hypothetical protein VHM01_20895 [Alphaproteobacteria bacterium]|nr:hypothetical protein [Alphaproteobacteria bacterium]